MLLVEAATMSPSGRPTLQGDPQADSANMADSDTVVVNITVENLAEDPQISDETIADFLENGPSPQPSLPLWQSLRERPQ